MALYSFKGSTTAIVTDCLPLPAAVSGVKGTKTITFATNASAAGKYYWRIGSYLTEDLITQSIASGATPVQAAEALVSLVNAKTQLPYTAANTEGVVTLTAKTADETSNKLSVTNNIGSGESDYLPSGMTVTIAAGTAGSGQSVITGLTSYLKSEDTPRYTSVVQPYYDTTIMDAIKNIVGNPNEKTGLYDEIDYRPFNNYVADTTGGTDEFDILVALGAARKETDCANILFSAPTYPELGFEIACYKSGKIDLQSLQSPATEYTRLGDDVLWGPLTPANDFTTHNADGHAYDNVNALVTAGITPIIYKNSVARLGDVTGFWHPADNQNAPFKYVVNRIKIWNCQKNVYDYLNGTGLKDAPIVNSVAAVRASDNPVDADTIKAGLAAVTGILENYALLFDGTFTIKNTTVINSTTNPDRFDITYPVIVSGNNRVNSAEIDVDRNLQAVNLTIATA